MTEYLLKTPGLADKVLFVRRLYAESKWRIAAHRMINRSTEGSKIYVDGTLGASRSADEMQKKLDAFARRQELGVRRQE